MFSRWSRFSVCINHALGHWTPTTQKYISRKCLLQNLKAPRHISPYTTVSSNCFFKAPQNKSHYLQNPHSIIRTDDLNWQVKGHYRLAHYNPSNLVLYIKNEDDANQFCTELWETIRSRVLPVNSVGEKALENLEKIIYLLSDLKCDTRNIFGVVSKNPRIVNVSWKKFQNLVTFLINLGLGGNPLLHVLNNHHIWTSDVGKLSERVRFFRKVGILEGDVQKLVTKCPQVLTLPKGKLNSVLNFLRDNRFTREQIVVIVNECSNIFESNLDEIEYLFQYVYFRMGLTDHKQMVKAKLFRHSLEHVRQRHLFLLRLGLYETPNVRSQTKIINPKLHIIIDTSLSRFCKMFQVTSVEEFNIFCQELMEEDGDSGVDSADSDDIDESEIDYNTNDNDDNINKKPYEER